MIAMLSGKVIYKKTPALVIECAGVGYEVEATLSVFTTLPNIGEMTTIYTHLSIRDDAHVLFGFVNFEERDLFRLLIKVNGIGPKLGILILSGMSPEHLSQAIIHADTSALVKLPGIGKKTAERLVMELKDKFKANIPTSSANLGLAINNGKVDAIEALVSLGYKDSEAEKMVANVYDEGLDSEQLIRLALQAKMK